MSEEETSRTEKLKMAAEIIQHQVAVLERYIDIMKMLADYYRHLANVEEKIGCKVSELLKDA